MELRLGPGFAHPPTNWVAHRRLGLRYAKSLRVLRIFVECDPASSDVFRGWVEKDRYTNFSRDLVRSVMEQVPSLQEIQFDAYPSVSKVSPLLLALITEIEKWEKRIVWAPAGHWKQAEDVQLVERGHKM